MHSPSSCSRTAWGNSPSLGVKDPISSQSQKNEGCFLKWFQLSWEGEVPCYLRVVHPEYLTQLSHTHLDGSLQVTDEDIGEMQISEVLSGGRCLLMSRVWQQCVDALTFTMEKTLSSTHWEGQQHTLEVSLCIHLPWSSLSLLYCVSPLWNRAHNNI